MLMGDTESRSKARFPASPGVTPRKTRTGRSGKVYTVVSPDEFLSSIR